MKRSAPSTAEGLRPYLSPVGAWALALGTSIGWGSLVITSNTYLSQAGPLGSVLGLLVGAAIMLVVARNYHYMMNCCPEAGGAYAYVRDSFGYDHGFLAAWFMALTYLAMLWANATSLPLFARYFIGNLFRFGRLYSLFGYEVYLGEALLSIAALLLVALLCARGKKGAVRLLVGMACFFTVGIIVCLAGALLGRDTDVSPLYIPDRSALSQVVRIACISPWAFIGFENISHATEEFSFPREKSFRVLTAAVITATVLYVAVTLLSVTAYPPQYDSWLAYIRDHEKLSGIEGLPAFYAAYRHLGNGGVLALILSLLCLIVTSLIGNILALSRLIYALAGDEILPKAFRRLNDEGVPARAVWLIAGISLLIPFLGRTAVGWIVDVTTLGATILYGFVSACAWKTAAFRGDRTEVWTGRIGLVVMAGFLLYLLVPNLFTSGTMETESFFLFVVWSILGFVYFRVLLQRDRERHFGNSIVVWISLLSLVLFVSLVWMSQSGMRVTARAMSNVQGYYRAVGFSADDSVFVRQQMEGIRRANARSIVVVLGLFGLSLGVLLNNFSVLSRRARESEAELGQVRSIANTDPLTGVKSKYAYTENERALNVRLETGELRELAVVVCDVNGLKHINDTLGHKAGDAYIRSASILICEMYQHSPVYRIGGDEFAVLLSDRDYERREEILRAIHRQVEENLRSDKVVVSVGMSEFRPGEDTSLRAVFERADARMYQRKNELKAMGARTR